MKFELLKKLTKNKIPWVAMILLAVFLGTLRLNWWGIYEIPLDELKALYAGPKSEFVDAGGLSVHLRDEGTGPVLVLLHGVLSSLNTWEGWTPALTAKYRVISLDLPGFGLTGYPPGAAYDAERVMDIIRSVLAHKGVKRATFIGNSFGGFLSWKMAVRHPELVERLVVIDGKSFPQTMPPLLRMLTLPVIRQIAPRMAPRPLVALGVRQVYGDAKRIGPDTVRRYHDLLLRPGNRAAMITVFAWLKDTGDEFRGAADPELLKIRQPLMTVWGRRDAWIPYDPIGLQWEKAYPRARHAVYEDAGHIPMEELPGRSVRDVMKFLCDTDPALGYACRDSAR